MVQAVAGSNPVVHPRGLMVDQAIDGLLKWRKVAFDYLKHSVNVDPEVLVGYQVAKASDVGPGDLGRRCARLLREVLYGLSDDHELEEQGIVEQRVFLGC